MKRPVKSTKRPILMAKQVLIGMAFNSSRTGNDAAALYYQRIADGLMDDERRRKRMEKLLAAAAKALPKDSDLRGKIVLELK